MFLHMHNTLQHIERRPACTRSICTRCMGITGDTPFHGVYTLYITMYTITKLETEPYRLRVGKQYKSS